MCMCACMCLCVSLSVLPVALGFVGKQLFHNGLHSNKPAGDSFVDQGCLRSAGRGRSSVLKTEHMTVLTYGSRCIRNWAYDRMNV